MKQLALLTTQNVVIEYPAATIVERFIAAILDLVILIIISSFLAYLFSDLMQRFDVDEMGWIFISLFPILFLVIYHALSEYFANGQTVGKKVLGIRVIRMDGQKAGLRESLMRSLFLIIDLVFSVGILGVLVIATSRRQQRLGDMAANTFVIKSNPHKPFSLEDISKIKSTDDYEVTYPQVTQFADKDILKVKETLQRYTKYKNAAHRKAFVIMAKKMADALDLEAVPKNTVQFIKRIIRDYIVLTR